MGATLRFRCRADCVSRAETKTEGLTPTSPMAGDSTGGDSTHLVASAKAMRIKPHAFDVRVDINPVHWFLNDRDDTRSRYYLEDAATESRCRASNSTGPASRATATSAIARPAGATKTSAAASGRT